MMRWLFVLVAALGVLATPAGADEYWITYEGNDFPEDVGWRRIYRNEDGWYEGGAERWIENGIFTLDTRESAMICDYYGISCQMDPDPGETFVAEWRLNIVQANQSMEVGVWMARDDPPGYVWLEYLEDEVWIGREHWSHPIEPHVFHTYRIESTDMVDYSLCVDGEQVHQGAFYTATDLNSCMAFGDPWYGGGNVTSLSQWDYVRFGVVPEPASLTFVVLTGILLHRTARR